LKLVGFASDEVTATNTTSEYAAAGLASLQLVFKPTGFLKRRLPTGGCAYGMPRK
jgi:hypothetical protein